MKWSIKIGSIAGTQLYLHWTFVLFLVWVFVAHLGAGRGLGAALNGVAFLAAIFGCVFLHEMGHALAARGYGIPTRDITLLPIGGLARLERIPEKPTQELWVALAGPAVNVLIAGLLFVPVALSGSKEVFAPTLEGGNFLARLLWVNVLLVAFNLLPAFPMDGGRVLRALLAMRLDRRRATQIAAGVGQAMAILFGVLGLFYNPMLLFIALFVFLGAQEEAHQAQVNTAIKDLVVADAMMTRFRTLTTADSLGTAARELLAGSQEDFPVLADGQIVGVLRRKDLVKGLSESGPDGRVVDAMCAECSSVNAGDSLEGALAGLRTSQCASVPVLRDRALVGLLTLENISELLMVNSALERKQAQQGAA
jgi:Zn-dependent protease